MEYWIKDNETGLNHSLGLIEEVPAVEAIEAIEPEYSEDGDLTNEPSIGSPYIPAVSELDQVNDKANRLGLTDYDVLTEAPPPPPKTQEQINAEHRAYLDSTDWYITRKMETGEEIPQDVLDARQAAREGVIE